MREIVIPRRLINWAFAILVAIAVVLSGLNLMALGDTVERIDRETNRAELAEQQIIQSTIDRIADVARQERVASCEADDTERREINAILTRFGIETPKAFAPRNCSRVGDGYAERLREAGPLTEGD